ncbi:MAG: MogA/MoaB family molybdenum cofactor biosynthesis protein [Acidobacteriota bacterium]|nr:MogA/MoaB family molybdenum cofactor biosynthesis protein [Acidobacteriota bacterium]
MHLAVLTISDRCSRGESTDTAGPAVVEMLRAAWPDAQIATALLPDDEDRIAAQLTEWEEQGIALILTAGGTGLGPRDRTPEATRRVIDREAPGIAELMRLKGSEKHAFSWLSRAVVGLRGATLIANLPGSLRGATESLEAILPLLRHAIDVAAGGQRHP